jgi:hypothetical protein
MESYGAGFHRTLVPSKQPVRERGSHPRSRGHGDTVGITTNGRDCPVADLRGLPEAKSKHPLAGGSNDRARVDRYKGDAHEAHG